MTGINQCCLWDITVLTHSPFSLLHTLLLYNWNLELIDAFQQPRSLMAHDSQLHETPSNYGTSLIPVTNAPSQHPIHIFQKSRQGATLVLLQ